MKFLPESFKNSWDKFLTRAENRGFKVVNKMHKYAINACLLFIAYQCFAFLR